MDELIEILEARMIVARVAFDMLLGAYSRMDYTTAQRAYVVRRAIKLMGWV